MASDGASRAIGWRRGSVTTSRPSKACAPNHGAETNAGAGARVAKGKKRKAVVARRRTADEQDAASWLADDDRRHASSSDVRWWTAEEEQIAAGRLWTWIERLRSRWSMDVVADLIHEAIYADEPLGVGFDGQVGAYGYGAPRFPRQAPANFNHVQSLVDSAGARLCKRRPMPVISGDNAGWTEKLFAKQTSRILRRKMGGPDVEKMSPLIVRDMIIRGTGVARSERHGGDTRIVRDPIREYVHDPREAFYGQPRTVAHVKPIDRETLISRYFWARDAIANAPTFTRTDPWMMYVYQGPTFVDHVEVAHAWHLPSGPDADDGQEIVAVRGAVLMRRRWRRQRFPFARCFWSPPLQGFRGRGLVQQL